MKKIKLYISCVLLFLFCDYTHSQTKSITVIDTIKIEIDTLPSQKGNLYLLTQRIHVALTAYSTGNTKLYFGREHPRVLLFNSDKTKVLPMSMDRLKNTSLDMVESIEITDDEKKLPALYGVGGLFGIIKIKLFENDSIQ